MTRIGPFVPPLAGLAVALGSCAPITSAPDPMPLNSCPAHPCEAYATPDAGASPFGSPECLSGACLLVPPSAAPDGGVSPTNDLVLLVTTSQTGFFFPGLTYALPWDALRDEAAAADGGAGTTPGSASLPAALPGYGMYLVAPALAEGPQGVNYDLGTPSANRLLPFIATFKPLTISRPDGSTIDLGPLPMPTMSVASVQTTTTILGPFNTVGTTAAINVAPATYLETLTPAPPFDQAFGPVSVTLMPSANDHIFQGGVDFYDKTLDSTNMLAIPKYTIKRQGGSFDGWTAYLRDVTTRQPVSNIAPLSGVSSPVQFALRRVFPGNALNAQNPTPDALSNVQVVVAPPTGSSEATGLFIPQGDPPSLQTSSLNYLTLPPPVTVNGSVRALQGAVGTVDLAFEALAVTSGGQLDPVNFEFTAWTKASPDRSTGLSTFTVVVPPGEYRVDARPRSGGSALAVVDLLVPVTNGSFAAPTITLGEPQPTVGTVRIADGRALPGATVVGVPVACAAVSRPAVDTMWCLPSSVRTTSGADGSFVLGLDPGSYRIHVEPPGDSRLPWVDSKTTVVVRGPGPVGAPPAGTLPVGPLVVPAPLSLGLRLTDSLGLLGVPDALVRAFRISGAGPTETAIELGDAVTDADGRYELFVAPPD
jgi:hypothetical protein